MATRPQWAALALMACALTWATAADAQDYPDYRVDIGINGGFTWYTAMLDDEHLGSDSEDVRFEPGWLTGAQLTFWVTPRFGLRANGTYTERPLIEGTSVSSDSDSDLIEDINIWGATGDLLFRPLSEPYSMFGLPAMPYLAVGAGIKYSDPAVEVALDEDHSGLYFDAGGNDFIFVEETKPMGLVGLGTDLRLADNFGLRIEVGDRFWDAPLRYADTFASDPEEDVGNVVHEPYVQLGLHALLGLSHREVIAVSPSPPAPEPEPEPEPEPVEERISVCVIDPSAAGGVARIDAIYLPETGDTLVVDGATRRPFATAVPGTMLAGEAQWLVRGEPLTLAADGDLTYEYTTWQSGRVIDAPSLTYLGTARGLPVYASTDDIRDLRQRFATARGTAGDDLAAVFAANPDLLAGLDDVEFLYVPLRSAGCVFQAMRMVEQVRKK